MAEWHDKSLQFPLCVRTLKLTLIHESVNAILWSLFGQVNFVSVSQTESDRLICPELHLNRKLTEGLVYFNTESDRV